MTSKTEKVVIVGSGPAGYTAAIYAARSNLDPVLIAGMLPGGQLMTTDIIENFPGFPSISGPELMDHMKNQAKQFGTHIINTNVTAIDTANRPFKITLWNETVIESDSVIIATGAEALWLDADGERELRGRGISTCATCDGPFFKNRDIVVIGGGDSAMEEALYLTRFGRTVRVIHRRDAFRASKIMQSRVIGNPKINIMYNTTVKKWLSTDGVLSGAIIETSGSESEISCEGAFIAIGHKPSTSFLDGTGIETDDDGYITEAYRTMTSIPGIFVCGDVSDRHYKQAITAAGKGCQAALDCERWLESIEK